MADLVEKYFQALRAATAIFMQQNRLSTEDIDAIYRHWDEEIGSLGEVIACIDPTNSRARTATTTTEENN